MFAASLPDLDSLDLEAAKALLIAQHESYTATLSSRSTEIERLVLLVEKLQRMLFDAGLAGIVFSFYTAAGYSLSAVGVELDDAAQAYRDLHDGNVHGRAVVVP